MTAALQLQGPGLLPLLRRAALDSGPSMGPRPPGGNGLRPFRPNRRSWRLVVEGATWLCERVLPPVPLRQWVLSLPKALRYLLAYDGRLCRAVARTALGEVFRWQRLQARRRLGLKSTQDARPGAMVAVQRFSSALNLNIHLARASGPRASPGNRRCRFRPAIHHVLIDLEGGESTRRRYPPNKLLVELSRAG